MRYLKALPYHARDIHECEGGRCDFYPLCVCTCKESDDKENIQGEGKPLTNQFHALLCNNITREQHRPAN